MSDQEDKLEIEHLGKVNAELTRSLARCRTLLDECRSKLAANSNEDERAEDSEDSRQA